MHAEVRDCIAHDWWSFLGCALPDCMPLLLPNNVVMARRLLDELKPCGLVLTGGNDIGASIERDESESLALSWMMARNHPVIGICRGMQFMVQQLGGVLSPVSQDLHIGMNHALRVFEGRPLPHLLPSQQVNSYHAWQAIPDEASPLKVWAVSAVDGAIEAVYAHDMKLLGIMWHPEREQSFKSFDQALFASHFRRSNE
ncbi:gamma-glutamyl-gamma-aminobutyrate hydrolase family protein [Trichlorobacter lovleyi]|nr:gamma-glutamyl-gamma-aminobutyrate hydrolase family protein [Trichlorobacter lovleyi]